MKKMILGTGIVLVAVSYIIGSSYYEQIFQNIDFIEEEEEYIYEYQFDMIVDREESAFWQAVYESGKKEAEKKNALLFMNGTGLDSDYSKTDYMKMSIASQVDGIILEYTEEPELEDMIKEAVLKGIPVITIMGDAPYSGRQSFVGISDYQLGIEYAAQVCNFVDDSTESIIIFQRSGLESNTKSTICAEISKAVLKKTNNVNQVKVEERNILSMGTFEIEESIRDIFQDEDGPPDIVVCMDEETTECARQALLDYNLAGKVTILGYYTSDRIVEALEKEIIAVTCNINTEQMGVYSVDALVEYLQEGRVSSYYDVDIEFTDTEALKNRKEGEESDEEIFMEESALGQ